MHSDNIIVAHERSFNRGEWIPRLDDLRCICIPANWTVLRQSCFAHSKSLSRVTFERNSCLKCIDSEVFRGCNLREIEIPASVEIIGSSCFEGELNINGKSSSGLSRITFADGCVLKCIGTNAFKRCNLKDIEIPAKVQIIASGAFQECTNLLSVTFENGSCVKTLDSHAFAGCSSLERIKIPASVEEIGDNCFGLVEDETGEELIFCDSLFKVTFAKDSNLKRIGHEAFAQCVSLRKVKIPSSVTDIGNGVFAGCFIDRLRFSDASSYFTIEDPFLIRNNDKALISIFHGKTEFHVPATIEKLGDGCFGIETDCYFDVTFACGINIKRLSGFTRCVNICDIEIPATVEEIGCECFYDSCVNVVSFANGSVLKCIGDRAFQKTKDLTEINIPASVEKIGEQCFAHSLLRSITFEQNSALKHIGDSAFMYCPFLVEVEIPAGVEVIPSDCFLTSGLKRITFADGSVLRSIEDTAFYECSALEEIEIPASVEKLGFCCFGSSPLSRMTFANGSVLKCISEEAFSECQGLKEIEIPATVEEIGAFCFEWSPLVRVTFAKGSTLKYIRKLAFAECSNLVEIELPASVEEIGYRCFENCKSLSKVTFASGSVLKRIDAGAFMGCKLLLNSGIELPTGVEEIGVDWNKFDVPEYSDAEDEV